MNLLTQAGKFLKRNSRTILTMAAVGGTLTTAYMASRDTYKSKELIDDYKDQYQRGDISGIQFIGKVAPCYIPTAMAATATVTAIVGAHTASSGKIAAMSSAYSMAQEAASIYRQKVKEVVGEEKAREIESAIHADQIERASKESSTVVVGTGEVLFMDAFTGRLFPSTMNIVEKARNDVNYELINEMYVSLNEFYSKIGLDHVSSGDNIGWNNDHQLELNFDSKITNDGRPCIVMSFVHEPTKEAMTLL